MSLQHWFSLRNNPMTASVLLATQNTSLSNSQCEFVVFSSIRLFSKQPQWETGSCLIFGVALVSDL